MNQKKTMTTTTLYCDTYSTLSSLWKKVTYISACHLFIHFPCFRFYSERRNLIESYRILSNRIEPNEIESNQADGTYSSKQN
mmetsp:Transcript_17797/g.17988  ORF Transcript_17797/g.17988 Transcript_17797/m.17988 type:complete len:82 (+) Transcript_17797:690-935(+)